LACVLCFEALPILLSYPPLVVVSPVHYPVFAMLGVLWLVTVPVLTLLAVCFRRARHASASKEYMI